MSWKIQQIVIKNFKFFHEKIHLDVNSKHLLIYGENGSGKSSIYWALYTMFQSRLKPTLADVEKYFDDTKDENLLNKYIKPGEDSKIDVTFEDLSNPAVAPMTYTISLGNVNTRQNPDVFLDFTISSSDFLNYKMLSKLTDKDNSVVNDVTEMFVKEIYPFAEFKKGYTDLNGNPTGIRNAMQWHKYIMSSLNQVEHQRGKRHKHFDANGPKYALFKKLIREFREELKLYLDEISIRATGKLRDEFNIKDIEVRLETDPEYTFDKPTSPKYRDHFLHPLHIRLNAKYKNAQLSGGERDIIHLRTFFNEAKLTCIGLAIRLAVVDYKFSVGGNYASLLCLDDLLVSLDMSYRVPVTESLLRYANNYQLFLFTHDRSLYHMVRGTINELGYAKDEWKYLEFYRPDNAKEAIEEPKVCMVEPKEGIEQVRSYIGQGDYPAAGNCLRKYAEELIKGILPLNLTYGISNNGDLRKLMLRGLHDNTRSTRGDGFLKLYDISKNEMPDISKHLNRLMNPLSHDDKNVPIFRQELEAAITEVQKYEPIRAAKRVIVSRQDAGKRLFKMEMTNAGTGVTNSVEFVTTEQWDYFDFTLSPMSVGRKYKNCEVLVMTVHGCTIPLNCKMRVKTLYEELLSQSHLSAAAAPDFDQSIIEMTTGTLLSAM